MVSGPGRFRRRWGSGPLTLTLSHEGRGDQTGRGANCVTPIRIPDGRWPDPRGKIGHLARHFEATLPVAAHSTLRRSQAWTPGSLMVAASWPRTLFTTRP